MGAEPEELARIEVWTNPTREAPRAQVAHLKIGDRRVASGPQVSEPTSRLDSVGALLAYYEATHRLLTKTIQELPADRFTETPQSPLNFTIEQIFGHLVIEENQHVGQIDYLKGQQQSLGS